MSEDGLLRRLLEEALDSGRTPEDVCAEHPEHLEEVRARLRRIQHLAADLDRAFPTSELTREPGGRGIDESEDRELPQIPGYSLDAVIGRGGMGVVYRARHIKLDRVVAIKMLRYGDHASARELASLVREAQSIAGLKHPHIVQVYDVGELNGLPYFTMEFVEGGSLSQLLSGAPQAVMKTAEWVSVLAHAVHAAHDRGIVHRDLKPGNVLVAGDGTLKITDFGLARRFDGSAEAAATIVAHVGTPSYMPPEQALGTSAAFTPAADIYSLGAILYEMLTGRPPFRGESPVETERQVVHDEPVPPSRLNPRTPRDLQTICLKCLQKPPERRYASARELAEDLDRFRRGEPIRARPAGMAERAVKWARRRPTQAVLLAAGLGMIAAGFAVSLWYQRVVATRRAELAFRETESRTAVENALSQVSAAISAEAWNEADRALAHAKERVPEAHSGELETEIASLGGAIGLARELEQTQQSRVPPLGAEVRLQPVLDRYAGNFREAGVPVEGDTGACAALVRESPIRQQLLVALDTWANLAYDEKDADQCERLLAIAREADPSSAWRDRFRAQAGWRDREALIDLAMAATDATGTADGPSVHQIGLLGLRLGKVGAADAGAELLRAVLRQRPGDFWMNWELARCEMDRQRFQEAVSPLRAAVAIRPDNAFACDLLAIALSRAGDPDEGIQTFRHAIALAPDFPRFRWDLVYTLCANGRWQEAEAEYRGWQGLDDLSREARKLFLVRSVHNRRYEEALAVTREILDQRPQDSYSWQWSGRCLVGLGRLPEAEAAFREFVRQQPRDGDGHALLAKTLFSLGRVDEAIAEAQAAVASPINRNSPTQALGEALIARGRLAEASAAFEQIQRESPSTAAYWIGLCRAELGLLNFAQVKEILDLAPKIYLTVQEREELARLAELDALVSRLQASDPAALTAVSPDLDPPALRDVAEWKYRCVGNPRLAIRQFESALAGDPRVLSTAGPRTRICAGCAALAAAEMPASSPDDLAPEDRAHLRALALEWLTSERDALLNRRAAGDGPERVAVASEFRSWIREPAILGARADPGPESDPDFGRWQSLWRDIEAGAALDDPDTVADRARLFASVSDWPHASESYAELFSMQPDQDGETWFEYAAIQLLVGDLDGYRRACAGMLKAQPTSTRIRSYHVARAWTLAPWAHADLSGAEQVGMSELLNSEDSAWALTELGAFNCRAGRYTDAIAQFKQSIDADSKVGMAILNWLWLALANEGAGSPAEARRWFAKADVWLGRLGGEAPPENEPSSIHLHNWLEAQILHREAAAAIATYKVPE